MKNKEIEELLNEHNYPLSDYYLFNKKDIDLLLSYIEQLEKQAELGEHYKHLYSEVKKQKDDVVEYIKKYDVFKEFSFPLMKKWEENQVKSSIDYQFKESIKKDLLRMLGEIDE